MAKKKSVEKSNPECRRSLTDRSELQKFVLHLLQGAMIGIGAVLPGISGGVLSVVFGIYEPIMAFLSNPREALSQYGRLLLPVLLGAAGGFLLSARAIGFFLTRYEVLSVCLFVGLIVGMLPSMFREAGEKGRSRWHLYALAGTFFTVLILLGLLRRISVSIPQGLFGNLFCGFCVALSIIAPGMSFSALLMPLGLYTPFMEDVGAVYLPVVPCWGKCNGRRYGAAASFFLYRKRSVRRMLTEDGLCAALWKTGCRRKVYPFLIFNSRLVYCILGGMQ